MPPLHGVLQLGHEYITPQMLGLIRLLNRNPITRQRSEYSTEIRLLNRNPNTQQKPDYNARIRYIRQKSDILIQKSDYSTGILFSYTVPLKGGESLSPQVLFPPFGIADKHL